MLICAAKLRMLLLLAMATACASAQVNVRAPSGSFALPEAPSQSKDQQKESERNREAEKEEQSQRTLGLVPRFITTDRMNAPALTTGEKFSLFARTAFDPLTGVIAAGEAGLSQADNRFAEYGPGAAGYGKRFGAAFGDQVTRRFFSVGLYPTIFKQDPRYFRLKKGSFMRRFGYSLMQELICHTDSGGRAFNVSSLAGAFTSGAVSNAYYPPGDRGFSLTMTRGALQVGYETFGNFFDEFWPDISRKLFHKKKRDEARQPASHSSQEEQHVLTK
jgi:hypothetical protein